MPATELAAKRYAQAAFELAAQAGNLAEWSGALDEIASFMGDDEVRRVLENTRVAQEAKQQLIEAALADLAPLPLNLARLLVRKSRPTLAGEIAAEFKRLAEAREGVVHARALTAVELSGDERESLARRLREQTGRQIVLETAVEPGLVGGVVVQIGDRLIDASTRGRLAALRKTLAESMA